MNQTVLADPTVMSVENFFIYVCAWCCIQPVRKEHIKLHNPEFAIACRGGIVFW